MSAAAEPGSAAGQPVRRNTRLLEASLDVIAAAVAVSLPWSTSATGILMAIWFVVLAPTIELRALVAIMRRAASWLPVALVLLAVLGLMWSEGSWADRWRALSSAAKLLAIPFLFYHFARSRRANWVFLGFLAGCTLLLVASFGVYLFPITAVSQSNPGVPVKNYIDQSQEFALCLFALALPLLHLVRAGRWVHAGLCAALMAAFLVDMLFVVSARTALVYMPVMLVLFGVLHLSRRAMTIVLVASTVVAGLAWFTSPYLRDRVSRIAVEYQGYGDNEVTSTAQRLEYWRKSLNAIAGAPVIGNGTGSTRMLFAREAQGQTGLRAEVIGNPHNQTLAVAVQWGLAGVFLLYAMWLSHGLLFRSAASDPVAWLGLLVVVQNVTSSLFNSHLFDFHEGWMYVLGVGVAGGAILGKPDGAVSARSSRQAAN